MAEEPADPIAEPVSEHSMPNDESIIADPVAGIDEPVPSTAAGEDDPAPPDGSNDADPVPSIDDPVLSTGVAAGTGPVAAPAGPAISATPPANAAVAINFPNVFMSSINSLRG
ncbi:hypothetical protein [Nocardia sp. NRRL WC-3656]|uniref:hypothetical protein n=1 Tax=Nocardia sp. NRRL WC-3656 TaxID=1463824 RepID=UPI0004C3736C|nr:hypothetical protein [Nocardia sp. NRRL WC-3656]